MDSHWYVTALSASSGAIVAIEGTEIGWIDPPPFLSLQGIVGFTRMRGERYSRHSQIAIKQ